MARGQQRRGDSAEDKRQRPEIAINNNHTDNDMDQRQPQNNTDKESGLFGSDRSALIKQNHGSNWKVKKLTDICRNKCANNFSLFTTLGDTRKCYFKLVEPILGRMAAQQLRDLEKNSYPELAQETKQLWKRLIEKDFPKYKFDDANNTSYSEIYHSLENELSFRRTKALENLKKNYEKHQSLKQSKSTIALNESASIKLINLTVLKKRKKKLFSFDNEFKSPTMKKLHKDVQKTKIVGPPLKAINSPVNAATYRVPYPSGRVYQSSLRRPTILNKIKNDTVTENKRSKKSAMSFSSQNPVVQAGSAANNSRTNNLKRSSLFANGGSKRKLTGGNSCGPRDTRGEYKRPRVTTSNAAKSGQSSGAAGSSCHALPGNNGISGSSQRFKDNSSSSSAYSSNGMAVYDPQLIASESRRRMNYRMDRKDFASRDSSAETRRAAAGDAKNGKQKLVKSSLFK